MGKTKTFLSEQISELDTPYPETSKSWFKKGKLQIILIYPDSSYKINYVKIKDTYTFVIDDKRYLIIPKTILKGKNPTAIYYFNNPSPLFLEFENSKISSLDLQKEENIKNIALKETLANVYIDAKSLNTAFNNNLINKMFAESKLTPKVYLMMGIAAVIIILVVLQLTGAVDVVGAFTGTVDKLS